MSNWARRTNTCRWVASLTIQCERRASDACAGGINIESGVNTGCAMSSIRALNAVGEFSARIAQARSIHIVGRQDACYASSSVAGTSYTSHRASNADTPRDVVSSLIACRACCRDSIAGSAIGKGRRAGLAQSTDTHKEIHRTTCTL